MVQSISYDVKCFQTCVDVLCPMVIFQVNHSQSKMTMRNGIRWKLVLNHGFIALVIPSCFKSSLVMIVLPKTFGTSWMNFFGTIKCPECCNCKINSETQRKVQAPLPSFVKHLKTLLMILKMLILQSLKLSLWCKFWDNFYLPIIALWMLSPILSHFPYFLRLKICFYFMSLGRRPLILVLNLLCLKV